MIHRELRDKERAEAYLKRRELEMDVLLEKEARIISEIKILMKTIDKTKKRIYSMLKNDP